MLGNVMILSGHIWLAWKSLPKPLDPNYPKRLANFFVLTRHNLFASAL